MGNSAKIKFYRCGKPLLSHCSSYAYSLSCETGKWKKNYGERGGLERNCRTQPSWIPVMDDVPSANASLFTFSLEYTMVTQTNFLGVHFDELLNLESHIELTCYKINKSLYWFNRDKNFLSKKTLKSLYFALVCISPHSPCLPTQKFYPLKNLCSNQK